MTFGLHPLAIEDVKHGQQRTKVELDHDVAFVVLRPIGLTDDDMIEQELFAFVGTRFLVTLRPSPAFEMREVVSRWERQPDLFGEGGGFAIYVLIDEVVDDYLTAIERFEDRTDDLENAVFAEDGADTDQDIQQALFRLKRQVVHLRRFAMPVRGSVLGPPAGAARDGAAVARSILPGCHGSCAPGGGSGRQRPRPADVAARGSRRAGREPTQRHHEAGHFLGRRDLGADPDRGDLRDELPTHA